MLYHALAVPAVPPSTPGHTAGLTIVPATPGPSRPSSNCQVRLQRAYTLNLVAPVIWQVPYDPMRDTLSHLDRVSGL